MTHQEELELEILEHLMKSAQPFINSISANYKPSIAGWHINIDVNFFLHDSDMNEVQTLRVLLGKLTNWKHTKTIEAVHGVIHKTKEAIEKNDFSKS